MQGFTTRKPDILALDVLRRFYSKENPYYIGKRLTDREVNQTVNDLHINLTDEKVTSIINNLIPFVNATPRNLAVLFGVAYDLNNPDMDRRRFKEAVKFLLDTVEEGKETFVLSIDPEFTVLPIGFDSLRTIPKCMSTLVEDTISVTIHEDTKVNWLKNIRLTISQKKDLSKYFVLKYTLTDTVNNKSGVFYFMFLKYPLSSKYAANPFIKSKDMINIHKGVKTIDTYIANDLCQYDDNSFYKAIEKLATQPRIQSVYFASAVSSHDRNPLIINSKMYRPTEKIFEFGTINYWYTDNRYLQGICEVLTLMRRIAETAKPVFYIILDSLQPTFAHPSLHVIYDAKYPKAPYVVPFLPNTTFDLSNPFVYYKDYEENSNKAKGGKRKTRKQTRKSTQ